LILELLRRLRSFGSPMPTDLAVIDQGSYFDSLEERQRRLRESAEMLERDRQRVALAVWAWARHTVTDRNKGPLPRLPRSIPLASWLDGLSIQEIFNLSQSDALSIWHHIHGDDRVAGVRAVQQLQKAVLYFPTRKPPKPDPERDRASGGGPRRPGGLK
jgi:hypothetical protein